MALRVSEAPKISNRLLISFFVILLAFLHLKGCNKYVLDVLGPNGAIVSINRAKMAKKGFAQKAIFWRKKNICFDLLQNGPKYTPRTNLHFDIDLGEELHR